MCPPKKGPWLKRKFSTSEPTIWISGDMLFVFQGEEAFHVFHSGFEEGPGGYMVDLRTSLWWTEACESSRNNWKKPKGNLHMQHGCELLSMLTVHCKATNPSPSSEKKKHPYNKIHNTSTTLKYLENLDTPTKRLFFWGTWGFLESEPSLRQGRQEVKFTTFSSESRIFFRRPREAASAGGCRETHATPSTFSADWCPFRVFFF